MPPGPPLGALTAGAGSARGSGLAERGRAGHPAPAAAPSRATARRRGAARDGRTYLCAASPSSPAVLQRSWLRAVTFAPAPHGPAQIWKQSNELY